MTKAAVNAPLQVGTEKAVKLLEKNIWDEKLLRELVDTMVKPQFAD